MIREHKKSTIYCISNICDYYRMKGYNLNFLENYDLPVINSVKNFCKLNNLFENDYDIVWYRGTVKDIIGRKKAIYIFWKKLNKYDNTRN